jgi:hypothetical protein
MLRTLMAGPIRASWQLSCDLDFANITPLPTHNINVLRILCIQIRSQTHLKSRHTEPAEMPLKMFDNDIPDREIPL